MISDNGNLMAIVTSHTVHLALLPDSSHLGQLPNKPIKLKTSTVGRTIHVLSQPGLASVLWHPCGAAGNCLVTITIDAIVRLWEFDEGNRWSSDTPSLAIDLKKLALGASNQEVFTPERGKNRAFSSDAVGMDVASACFGGSNSSDEAPWSSLTLWIAMKTGDVYALCPLLPSKWQPCSTLLPALSTTIVAKAAAVKGEEQSASQHSQHLKDQYAWISELDDQEPTTIESSTGYMAKAEIFRRPEHPAIIPQLQGPFQIFSDDYDDVELCDIHVIAAKHGQEELYDDDDDSDASDMGDTDSLSATVVCLMTQGGRCYIAVDLEGIEGQWLPRKKPKLQPEPVPEPYLVILEGLDTLKSDEVSDSEWPLFSCDTATCNSFFVSHSKGVFYFSLEPWISALEKEIQSSDSTGVPFRLDVFRNRPGTLRERILSYEPDTSMPRAPFVPACTVMEDSDLGYFVFTTCDGQPYAATLDRPDSALNPPFHGADEEEDDPLQAMNVVLGPTRMSYQPSPAFYHPTTLPSFLETHVQTRHQHLTRQQVRLSPQTLNLMTEAHRLLSFETHQQGIAAADLFRRCERLVQELGDQVDRVLECADRTERIVGEESDHMTDKMDRENHTGPPKLLSRLAKAQEKQTTLQSRFEDLKKRLHIFGGKPLSEKEKAWMKELRATTAAVGMKAQEEEDDGKIEDDRSDEQDETSARTSAATNGHSDQEENDTDDDDNDENDDREGEDDDAPLQPWQRCERIGKLKSQLLAQSAEVISDSTESNDIDKNAKPRQQRSDSGSLVLPAGDDDSEVISQDLRSRKIAQVMRLLEREYVCPCSFVSDFSALFFS